MPPTRSSWLALLSGPYEDVLVVGHAGLGVARLLGERVGEVVVHARADEHAGRGGAVLAGVEVAGDRDVLGGVLEVGVVEHDDRRLAAEFQVRALEVLRRGFGDLVPARVEPVIDTIAGSLVRHERAAGVAVAADHVEHARRQELRRDLGHQRGRHRRGVARLEHHAVAGGERGRDLPDRHHHRVVPRRDLADDADRLAPDVGGVPGHVLARAAALEHPRGAGEEADLVERRRDLLGARQLDRLAGVLALGAR